MDYSVPAKGKIEWALQRLGYSRSGGPSKIIEYSLHKWMWKDQKKKESELAAE